MDSDSDLFESADEDFDTDNEEKLTTKPEETSTGHDNANITELNITNLSLHEQKVVKDDTEKNTLTSEKEPSETTSRTENITNDQNENSTKNEKETEETSRRSRVKERVAKTREPKTKLGVKLGTKLTNKPDINWDEIDEKDSEKSEVRESEKRSEYGIPPARVTCWEEDVDWTPIEDNSSEKSSKLYSEKSTEDYWNNETDYMELPRDDKKVEANKIEEKNSENNSSSWGTWGNWGMSSLLSTATLSVSTLTNSVSQGITTVLETGIGAPDPEQLARLHKEKEKSVERTEENKPESQQNASSQIGFGLGNFVSGVTHITKLVETTGTKVLTGGLDTLEVIGKKTMEVLQEGDPGLKKKRALFKIDQNKPVLSQILREAKEKAEEESKFEETTVIRKPHYETIFDDYQGLVHLEALEMLSKQCDIKLETMLESCSGKTLSDHQETLAQIKELCELPDEDEENDITDVETVQEKIENAVKDLDVNITYERFIKTWINTEQWLHEDVQNENEVHQKAIESLAELTAIAVEQFHKAGELLLIKERRCTVDEADSLAQLTIILTAVIGVVAGKFSEKLNTLANSTNSDNINNLITNIFLEASNSSSYIQDAFNLMVPVLQVGAI